MCSVSSPKRQAMRDPEAMTYQVPVDGPAVFPLRGWVSHQLVDCQLPADRSLSHLWPSFSSCGDWGQFSPSLQPLYMQTPISYCLGSAGCNETQVFAPAWKKNLVFLPSVPWFFPCFRECSPPWLSSLEISRELGTSDGPSPARLPLFLCSPMEVMRSGICVMTTIFPEALQKQEALKETFHIFSELLENILFPIVFYVSI